MSIVAVDTITDAAGGNTASINGIPLRQGVIDPENRIINGAFDFWQRGTGFSTYVYGADRWINAFGAGTVTQSRQAFAVGDTLGSNNPTYFLRQTVSGQTLAGDFTITRQYIEDVRCYAGQTITVLGWARRSSGTGNMSVEAEQYFGTGGTPSASVTASAPAVTTLSATWQPFAAVITVPSITGKTLGTNGNHYLGINFWTSSGSTYAARSNNLGLQTIGVDFWGIHIKLGVHTADATALYKQPELGPELARCQRYYQTMYVPRFSAVLYTVNGDTRGNPIILPTNMRASPSVSPASFTSPSWITFGFGGEVITPSNPTWVPAVTFSPTQTSFDIQQSGYVAGYPNAICAVGGIANTTFLFDAEL